MERLQAHPLARLFPAIPPDEMAQVVADIKAHGVMEPIWMYEGKVLDGWHRYQAAIKAGKEPKLREWKGDDPMAFVISMNVLRRHLNESQRAMLLVKAADEAGRLARGKDWAKDQRPVGAGQERGELAHDADLAKQVHVGERTVTRARRVLEEPKLAEKVIAGKISLAEADQVIAAQERKAAGKPPIEDPRTYKPKPELAAAMRQLVNAVRDLLKLSLAPEDKRFIRAKLTELMEKMR